jgi:hypothetical protein
MFRRFSYNNYTLSPMSIYAFNNSIQSKPNNDINNKTRENIIGSIINERVPTDYYIINKWSHMKTEIKKYVNLLHDGKAYKNIKCEHKGGRGTSYDFMFIFSYDDNSQKHVKVELKFNALSIDDAPQFVSPAKPSKFIKHPENISYEEYYYTNYLPKLSEASCLPMPSKEDYISTINSNKPLCMEAYKSLYKTDATFNGLANEQSRKSISSYIERSILDIASLSEYLCKTQNNKHYMLYNAEKGEFALEKACIDDYKIQSVSNHPEKYIYECKSENGKKLNVLLRWKNGNGIAFPAFQISSSRAYN